jgi:hypothetical protein
MHSGRALRGILVLLALVIEVRAVDPPLNANVRATLDRISASSMRGNLSFLASDLLQGRSTPSPGLDLAAEYIAAQFRRAGLEPAGDNGYFQTAKFATFEADKPGATIEIESDGKHLTADPRKTTIRITRPVSLQDAPVLKLGDDFSKIANLHHADVQDKVIAFYLPGGGSQSGFRAYAAIRELRPALLIVAGPVLQRQQRPPLVASDRRDSETPIVAVSEGEFSDAIEHAAPGSSDLKITVQIGPPKETPVTLRNVAAILRGSDPELRDTFLLVTAHYDHLGVKPEGDGDRIYNGANDDGSGTVSVIEIAAATAAMDPKPKRSILFIALFGEELGLLGSQYYGRHPLVPLASTIADINLEHMGRTDAADGQKISTASFTGFDYSEMPTVFEKAGERVGVKVYKDDKRSDAFFERSDNQALADLGIPAHTMCVAFEFPDYHGVGDEWQKIDYENMARVDRMVALGLITLSNSETPPKWNDDLEKTKRYAAAWRALHKEGYRRQ